MSELERTRVGTAPSADESAWVNAEKRRQNPSIGLDGHVAPRPTYRPISLAHLQRMSDDIGLFEHARHAYPRVEHGYCVDDVARGLIVTARESGHSGPAELPHSDHEREQAAIALDLARLYLNFIAEGQEPDGRMRNRRNAMGEWTDAPKTHDAWGRALWGLGSAVAHCAELADEALALFDTSAKLRSPFSRSITFAALGAAEVLRVYPDHGQAADLLRSAIFEIGIPGSNAQWLWPEERLTYANACVAEAVIAAGELLHEPRFVIRGLTMLDWLTRVETNDGHISVTPVGGWHHDEPRPGFDQQPIEVAALAEAAARAHALTRDPHWENVVHMCASWFDGDNDSKTPMADHVNGAGFDGLERDGRNENCGAESTLAMLSTFQQARRLAGATP